MEDQIHVYKVVNWKHKRYSTANTTYYYWLCVFFLLGVIFFLIIEEKNKRILIEEFKEKIIEKYCGLKIYFKIAKENKIVLFAKERKRNF